MFQNFSFEGYNVVHIDWILPFENETLQNYALRISEGMNDENAVLIGLSFGGILSVEISKFKEFKKIFLISSAKTKNEVPFYFRFFGKLKILKIMPLSAFKCINFITYYIFGANTNFERKLLKDIVKKTDDVFLKWALHQIMNWKNINFRENIIHIHGNKDLILPHHFVKFNVLIDDGTHFMTINQSKLIERIILENLT